MSKRSVHLSAKTEEIIGFMSDEKTNGVKNFSGTINTGLGLLDQLMSLSKPELSEQEWAVLYNTYAGCLIEWHIKIRLASDVMDNYGSYDLTKMDDVSAGLINKLAKNVAMRASGVSLGDKTFLASARLMDL